MKDGLMNKIILKTHKESKKNSIIENRLGVIKYCKLIPSFLLAFGNERTVE